jgi:NADH dehydrogenase
MTVTRPTRILILGGGFGGVYTALTLEKLLKREIAAGDVELGRVSRENYMVFQPMLPRSSRARSASPTRSRRSAVCVRTRTSTHARSSRSI